MRPVLIVKTGTTLKAAKRRGDFEDWIGAGMGLGAEALEVRRVDRNVTLPSPDTVACVVITGSSAMVTDAKPWS